MAVSGAGREPVAHDPKHVLRIDLGRSAGGNPFAIDLVRVPEQRMVLLVLSEYGGACQRRTVVRFPYADATKIAKFLAGIASLPAEDEQTDPDINGRKGGKA